MSRPKTAGERIAAAMEAGHAISGAHVEDTARAIDRAIRRAQAKAWDEGFVADYESRGKATNPYRGRPKL